MSLNQGEAGNFARILTESLPYIQRFTGKTFVIKFGGNAMTDPELHESFARDVVLMKLVGMNPVIVHGGGPQIGQLLERLNIETEFVDGMRVTDERTMNVVEMVLGATVNKEIVDSIHRNGGRAIGMTGKDGQLIQARKLSGEWGANGQPDIGQVGEVSSIDTDLLSVLRESDYIPVIAPVAGGPDGQTYNINADLVAGKLAEVLQAEKLILLTNVSGLLDADGQNAHRTVYRAGARAYYVWCHPQRYAAKDSVCVVSGHNGVTSAHIIDGRVSHAALLEIFSDEGIGTLISNQK
jgi:acetylglutamate kinase